MFLCDNCGKTYSSSRALRHHQHLHTGEKPYHCDFCEKTFAWPDNAKKHMMLHTQEKPYDCELCEKQFRFSGELTLHLRRHFGIKPHICAACGRGFDWPFRLRAHKCKIKREVDELMKPQEPLHIKEKPHSSYNGVAVLQSGKPLKLEDEK